MLVSQQKQTKRDSQIKIKRLVYPVGPLPTNHRLPNQSCCSHPLISPPQLGHALCFPHLATSYQMLLCLSSATLSWCRADLAGFEGCRGYLCRYRAAHTPKEVQKPLFSLAPMQWKKTGKKFYLFSLSHSSKIKARERLPLPHWLPFWEI